jgi:diguanylate cyclase (GGDEF)-like protein
MNEISLYSENVSPGLKPTLSRLCNNHSMFRVFNMLIAILLLPLALDLSAVSASAESRIIGKDVCALANAPSLTAREALQNRARFDCSDDALFTEASHVWLLVNVSDLTETYAYPALRLRMSYHKGVTIAPVAADRVLSVDHYDERRLREHFLIPDQLVFPIKTKENLTPTHVLVGVEHVWDMTNWRDIAVVNLPEVEAKHLEHAIVFSLLIGLLLTPLMLTALVYFALRLSFLPYHFGMVLCGALYGFSWSGLIFALPIEITPIARSLFNHLSIPFAFFFACMLTRELCGRKAIGENWSRRLIIAGVVPIITSIILVGSAPNFSHYGSIIYHAGFLLPLVAITGTLISGSLKGIEICRIQLLAWSPMIAYVALRIMRGLGVIEPNPITQYGLFPSLIIEALLTTGVICWQIIQLRKQRDLALQRQTVLHDLANQDDLTGALNRRAFIEGFNQITAAGRIPGREITLLSIDLDHFKNVNDAHGHTVGDDVLIGVTNVLKSQCRGDDLCARFGGEEFSILLVTSSIAAADGCANRLRAAIENAVFPVAGKVTASIGLVHVDPEAPVPFDSWYSAADKALYVAKAKGRNRVQRSGWQPEYTSQEDAAYAEGWQVKQT